MSAVVLSMKLINSRKSQFLNWTGI